MVILQFNKLIRNKWIWGAFAIAISAFFAFDFLVDDLFGDRGREESRAGNAGTLAGEAVDASLFAEIQEDVRGIGRNRDWKTPQDEVNRTAWETYAALKVAGLNGIEATDAEVQNAIRNDRSFQQNGAFSFRLYQALLRENSMTPERFEASLKRRITLMRLSQAILGSAAWASPIELDQAVADMTDTFTVKVARFKQAPKDADKVKVDDAAVKAWYEKNLKSLELPERIKIRYVKYDATKKETLDKMIVTEDEMRDRYDATIDKYTSTDTNGVEQVKKFEEVKAEIEKDLRQIAAVQCFETNLNQRAYAVKAAKGASRLDEIAKEDGLKVAVSDYFTLGDGYQDGFMKGIWSICPGAEGFAEAVAELDSESEDLRYAVVASDKAVWLIEKAEVSAKHTPTFEEAKSVIRPRALRDAKADAFKASVEAIAKQGVEAVLKSGEVSTNLTFCVSEMKNGSFPDQMSVARAAMKLKAGEVSDFTLTGTGRALLVVCEKREAGDAAKVMLAKNRVQGDVTMLQQRQIPESWRKWNLERMGFETGDISSLEKVEVEE